MRNHGIGFEHLVGEVVAEFHGLKGGEWLVDGSRQLLRRDEGELGVCRQGDDATSVNVHALALAHALDLEGAHTFEAHLFPLCK